MPIPERRNRSLRFRAATALVLAGLLASLPGAPVAGAAPAADDDIAALSTLLDEFLANVQSVAMHERFWAEELVYTSSAGTRTTKAAILADLRAAGPGNDGPSYRAEHVDIRLYGDAAVVAFTLVAEPGTDGAARSEYLNTGTFLERGGRWQAVAWQATRVPAPASDD